MANPFVKGWKYFLALLSGKLDEHADPKIQIQQAIEEAQHSHQRLTQQAAAVIGNQRQLEMKLARQMSEVEKLQGSARQALVLADQARAAGDEAKAQQYEQTASTFATQLVAAEQSMEDLKSLHDQALQAAQQAKQAVEQNAQQVQAKLAERSQLLTQLEQAKMQEQVSASLSSMSELSAPGPRRTSTRSATRSRRATPRRSAPPSWRRTASRAGCARSSSPRCSWPGQPAGPDPGQHGGNQLSAPPSATAPSLDAGPAAASSQPAAEADADRTA
jgi:phage shock protein A